MSYLKNSQSSNLIFCRDIAKESLGNWQGAANSDEKWKYEVSDFRLPTFYVQKHEKLLEWSFTILFSFFYGVLELVAEIM